MFKNERFVVWEYVSNALDYVDAGTSPVVRVSMDSRQHRIAIQDNGRGMDWNGLHNFFVMHGENQDRKAGRPGRGRFGTGKSAAFGIGDTLRITTVCNGRSSCVELTRGALESADSGDPVPVKVLAQEETSDASNGTLIEIEGIHLRSLDQAAVTQFIERHLAHWPRDVTVLVNNHECEFTEPPIERVVEIRPEGQAAQLLAGAVLTLKVSKSPLAEDLRGISISSNGVWHETTMLASANKEMAEFLFGEVDIPALDLDQRTPPAFDSSRSQRLNPANELVAAIYGFIGPELEKLRKVLVDEHREQRASEEAKRLRKEAEKIEEVLNRDFDAFRKQIQRMKAAAAKVGGDAGATSPVPTAGPGDDDFLFGGDVPATVTAPDGEVGLAPNDNPDPSPDPSPTPRTLNPIVEPDLEGEKTGHYSAPTEKTKPRPRGGFRVEFANHGEPEARATYDRTTRTIYINLDFPQMSAALKGRTIEDSVFRRLAYEVAFSEYAVAVASEMSSHEEFLDPVDAIVFIRERLNNITRSAAALYEN